MAAKKHLLSVPGVGIITSPGRSKGLVPWAIAFLILGRKEEREAEKAVDSDPKKKKWRKHEEKWFVAPLRQEHQKALLFRQVERRQCWRRPGTCSMKVEEERLSKTSQKRRLALEKIEAG